MTGEDFLTRGIKLKLKIKYLNEALEYWHTRATSTSLIYNEIGRQKTNEIRSNEKYIFKIIEIEDKIKKELEKIYEIKLEIQEVISKVVDPVEQSILFKRYIEEKSWNEIANSENYTKRYIFRKHNKAIENVDKIIKEVGYVV